MEWIAGDSAVQRNFGDRVHGELSAVVARMLLLQFLLLPRSVFRTK